ncbi:MAG TPA: hypothetical protein VGJ86_18390 [Acidimicrobiales bacterium]|jgi:hypothetical protein
MDTTSTPTTHPPAYPVPNPGQDPRFTHGLLFDIAEVLHRHGYPQPAGTDWADLMLALSRFIYQNKEIR